MRSWVLLVAAMVACDGGKKHDEHDSRGRASSIDAGLATPLTPLTPTELAELEPIGWVRHRPGRAGAVLAAPHGSADTGTFEIAGEVARRTGVGIVTATGWFIDRPGASGRYNVNRPTERIQSPGSAITQPKSRIAELANRWYVAEVRRASGGPLRTFFELHVNSFPENAGAIEVATMGVDLPTARRFKLSLERARDARTGAAATPPPLVVHVEPDENPGDFSYRLTTTVDFAERAFMIEMPYDDSQRDRYVQILTDAITSFLGQGG